MSNFHRRLSFGGISPSKFVQKHSVGGISPKKFVQKHLVGGISPKKFVQKHLVGEISPKRGLRQPSAGAYGQKRRRRKGKRSFGGRGKTVNEKRRPDIRIRGTRPTIQRFNAPKALTTQQGEALNNSTRQRRQQFNRAKPSTTQRAQGANHSTSIHEHLLGVCACADHVDALIQAWGDFMYSYFLCA